MTPCRICSGQHRPDQPHQFAALTDAEFLRLMHTEELPTLLTTIQINKRLRREYERSLEVKDAERRRRKREAVYRWRAIPANAEKHRKSCREYMRRRAAKKKLEAESEPA